MGTDSLNGPEGETVCWVYILRCADDTLYTGWTNNLENRIAAHNMGQGAKYTRSRRPVELVYWESCPHKGDALRREANIKHLSRAQKLALISKKAASFPVRSGDSQPQGQKEAPL